MAKILCTIWALMLHSFGVSIFQTCFADATEDEYGKSLLTGPPETAFLFASGVYVLVARSTIFPPSFRKPPAALLCFYEFLATAFILEFAMACIWVPIDVLLLTTLPKHLCHALDSLEMKDTAEWIQSDRSPIILLSYVISVSFFLLVLYVTRSLDFSVLTSVKFTNHPRL
ncbi:uncharacterized protein LOC105703225 [Orussus abietinus]|uniref:uncharacterized protein LOC105703225 n=1 Tax=Orussus abietinus TaxID=222816 RepID=UPI00062500F6|nr:uncharacterized protein LOC105703225 [Orussus abietinus]